ncbi:MAG: hypothetical protein LBQ97_00515 [Fusobacteriaceae bacterium]|jgi:TrpR-related protein YerC/YecD|nr:hypothetical protein [Fusobacteriaceae bacterium]
MSNLRSEENDKLFTAFLKLKNLDECYAFFEDICTVKEIDAMATRLEAAKLLSRGFTYEEILKTIDISSATLSRVSRCLKYGPGGYRLIIDRVTRGRPRKEPETMKPKGRTAAKKAAAQAKK